MNRKPFWHIEIKFQPIAKDEYVKYKSFKVKGFITCKKKDLEEAIKYIAESTIANLSEADQLESTEWSVTKQQSMPIDFIFDPDLKKERDKQEKDSRGEKPKLSAPPVSKTSPI